MLRISCNRHCRHSLFPTGRLHSVVAASDSPQEAQEALTAERSRLADLREDRAGWVQQFNGGLQRIGIDRREQLTRGIIEIRSKYEQRLKDIKKSEHDSLPGEFVADISARWRARSTNGQKVCSSNW